MFKKNANVMFNHCAVNYPMIRGMSEQISEQMQRLYKAAKELRGIEGKSNVANLLNVSPQMVNNWEKTRPISNEGLITAQEKIGCDAIWLRDGIGSMTGSNHGVVDPQKIAELIGYFCKMSREDQEYLISTARGFAGEPPKTSGFPARQKL